MYPVSQCADPYRAAAGASETPLPNYRALHWRDVITLRQLPAEMADLKLGALQAAADPTSQCARQIHACVGQYPEIFPTRDDRQLAALRTLAICTNPEVTLDLLRDTGLPAIIATDLIARLATRASDFTIFERLAQAPDLDRWAKTVLDRNQAHDIEDDVLTLRILQTFAHDVAVPFTQDVDDGQVHFHASGPNEMPNLAKMLEIAIDSDYQGEPSRPICRNAYEAIVRAHVDLGNDRLWPHWHGAGDMWKPHPNPNATFFALNIAAECYVDYETESWLKDITPAGRLERTRVLPAGGARNADETQP
jgi:hypothetical protein